MVKQMNWTDRPFEFNSPLGIFPLILERFRGTPARLEDIIRPLPAQILTVKVDNSWSILENAGHLLDMEELGQQRLEDYLAHAEILTPADMTNRRTYEADHNEKSVKDLLEKFRTAREALVYKLEHLDESDVARTALHQRLNKPMRVIDWIYFMSEHDDHHMARISKLARILREEM
ncbi:MAG: DinB family protein [Planctomycetota bacterium]|jgi:hypothetical protein